MKKIQFISAVFLTTLVVVACGNTASGTKDTKAKGPVREVVKKEVAVAADDMAFATGKVTVSGTSNGTALDGKMIYLMELQGKKAYKLDSSTVAGGAFSFAKQKLEQGLYRLQILANNFHDIMISPDKEKDISFTYRGNTLNNGWSESNSAENKAWNEFWKKEKQTNGQISNLRRKRGRAAEGDKPSITSEIDQKSAELDRFRIATIKKYPNTVTAKFLNHYKSHQRAEIGQYWKDINFNDVSFMHSPIIADRIQDFMRTHSGGKQSGFLNCIDLLVLEAKEGDERMLEFVLFTMMDGFYTSGKESEALYIYDSYIVGEGCGVDFSEDIFNKAEGIKSLYVGGTPPTWSAPDVDGTIVNMADVVAKNKYTLLMYWASWCHKCETEVPQVAKIYNKYKAKGFEILSVSVDGNRANWLSGIEAKGTPGINISQLQQWESPVAKDYRVTTTPTFFLLDQEGKLVAKPTRHFEIDKYLAANLK